MRPRELSTKSIQALWRTAGDEGITIDESSKRLRDTRLERERLERERRKGKFLTKICIDGDPYVVALSTEHLRVLWREAGKASCTIEELIENWVVQWGYRIL